jgi:hypothetical protein
MKTFKTFSQFLAEKDSDLEKEIADQEEKDLVKVAAKDDAKGEEVEKDEEEVDADEIADDTEDAGAAAEDAKD